MLSFKSFLKEEKLMTPMTPKEWLKYDWRIEVFLKNAQVLTSLKIVLSVYALYY